MLVSNTLRIQEDSTTKFKLKPEDLKNVFSYDSLSGNLIKLKNSKPVEFNTFDKNPKVSFTIDSKTYTYAIHTIVWALAYNEWPRGVVFHKDFNSLNFRINNLMTVSNKLNYALLTAYRNVVEYCDIKIHSKDKNMYVVRYLSNNRLKTEKVHDMDAAKRVSNILKNNYKKFLTKNGAIPPS